MFENYTYIFILHIKFQLYLNNNNISILDSHLVARWDNVKALDIRANPWRCDCVNQWMVDKIIPLIKQTNEFTKQIVLVFESRSFTRADYTYKLTLHKFPGVMNRQKCKILN